MKLAAPKRQPCTSQHLCYHKSTHSRGCHICFSHSHILYEHLHAKADPPEMSLHDSVISGFCGMGLEVHVCWQTSGSLQNQEFWEFQKKAPLPNSATVVQAFNMSRNTTFSPFPVCREQSSEQEIELYSTFAPFVPTEETPVSRQSYVRSSQTPYILGMLILHKILEFPA